MGHPSLSAITLQMAILHEKNHIVVGQAKLC